MIQFQDLLVREHIVFVKAHSKDEALSSLVHQLAHHQVIPNEAAFLETLIRRENLMSTAIGLQAALPHAKMPTLDRFFLAIGISKDGIEWAADDEMPVKFIFLIGGPEDRPIEYLSLLSSLTKAIHQNSVREKLSSAHTADDVLAALRSG